MIPSADSRSDGLLDPATAVALRDRLAFVEVEPWRSVVDTPDPLHGSIPGAILTSIRHDFAGAPAGIGGHLPLPDLGRLREAAERWGGGRRIVVYARRVEAFTSATRAWFTLSLAGVEGVLVLDGGLSGWVEAGGALGRPGDAVGVGTPRHASSDIRRPQLRTIGVEDALAIAERGTLLDARPADAYQGVIDDPRSGHIPGSVHAAASELIDARGRLRSRAELRRWLLQRGAIGRQRVAAYCGGGVASSSLVFAGALLGQPIALYVGSWSDWSNRRGLPVEQGDAPLPWKAFAPDCVDEPV